MTATTTTTIQGVSVLSRERKKHGRDDVFELGLSPAGVEVRWPGRPVQQMPWDRVLEWEIEERKGYVLLTLRGRGATTPLVVPGWTLDDLEVLMRTVTSDAGTYDPDGPPPVVTDGNGAAPAAAAASAAAVTATPPPAAPTRPVVSEAAKAPAPAPLKPAASAPPARAATAAAVQRTTPAPAPAPTRTERRQQATRERRSIPVTWKMVLTVALLGALATAVTLVLLQSAGVINWGFLGPVA